MSLRQVAYLSTRPDVLAETLGYVQHFLPWLTSVLVVTPARLAEGFAGTGHTVITDEELAGPGVDLSAMDHQARNFLLRSRLCARADVDDVFLCSDDDYRPLKRVDPAMFVRDGRLVGHYFYDLNDWTYDETAYDRGQQNSLQLLAYLGAGTRAFASHMPQAMDKSIMVEASTLARRLVPDAPLCEWAVHYNLGAHLHPERFAEPEPYLTLGRPEYPNVWRRTVVPREYAFENFYPQLYADGHLYAGLPTALDPARVEQDAVEKLMRWRRLDLAVRRLEFPDDVAFPWIGDSRAKRTYFRLLGKARRTAGYLALGDRPDDA